MAFINVVQGLIFNSGSKNNKVMKDQHLQLGYTKEWCDTRNSCDGRCAPSRDISTSTHDLISYVWCTEGEGMVDSAQADADKTKDGNGHLNTFCPTCACRKLKQCCKAILTDSSQVERKPETRKSGRDAGTSTFDLNAYYWGTMPSEDSTEDEDMDDANDFVTEAGFFGGTGMHLAGRKRSRAAVDYGLGLYNNRPFELAPPVKKPKRRTAQT